MLCYKKQNHTHTSACNGNASRERKAHTKHVPTFLQVYTFKRRKMQSYTTNLKFPLEENIFNISFHCHCRCLFPLQFICHLVVYLCVSLSQRGYGGSRAFSLKCDPRWCDCPGLPPPPLRCPPKPKGVSVAHVQLLSVWFPACVLLEKALSPQHGTMHPDSPQPLKRDPASWNAALQVTEALCWGSYW